MHSLMRRPALLRLGMPMHVAGAGPMACARAYLSGRGAGPLPSKMLLPIAGKQPSRHLSSRSDGKEDALVAQQKRAQVAAYVEGQRLRGQVQRVRGPFRETRDGTQGAATVMALLLRPTSPSLVRLAAGLLFSIGSAAGMHWLLHPTDPFCVLSLGCGSFAYVGAVGTSHSLLWYSLAAPAAMFAMLVFPGWPSYVASCERGMAGQQHVRRRRDATGF